jgi:hypothetical protein
LDSAGQRDKALEIHRLLADGRRSLGSRQAGFNALFAAAPAEQKAALIVSCAIRNVPLRRH